MNTAYILVGLPGSGKSTYTKAYENHPRYKIVSTDAIRFLLYGDENIQGDGKEVFHLAYLKAKQYLSAGFNVIFDATNTTPYARKQIIKNIKPNCFPECDFCAVYFNTPIDECKKRNANRKRVVPEEVIDRMAKKLTPPTIEEGFSTILWIP